MFVFEAKTVKQAKRQRNKSIIEINPETEQMLKINKDIQKQLITNCNPYMQKLSTDIEDIKWLKSDFCRWNNLWDEKYTKRYSQQFGHCRKND